MPLCATHGDKETKYDRDYIIPQGDLVLGYPGCRKKRSELKHDNCRETEKSPNWYDSRKR